MDFRKAVVEALDRMVASEAVEKAIERALTKTVNEIVDQELRSYSEFGKQLTEVVKKSLALNGELDLPSYNAQILQIVQRQVEAYTRETIQKQVAENLQKILEPPPETITLSKLVETYREYLKDSIDAGCVCYGDAHEITVLVEQSDIRGFTHVYLDDEPNQTKHKCAIHFGVYFGSKPQEEGLKAGEVYHLAFQNQDVERLMFAGPFHGFERMLFQMKAAKSKVIFDCDVDDLEKSYGHVID
jgi:hypothetical protein